MGPVSSDFIAYNPELNHSCDKICNTVSLFFGSLLSNLDIKSVACFESGVSFGKIISSLQIYSRNYKKSLPLKG